MTLLYTIFIGERNLLCLVATFYKGFHRPWALDIIYVYDVIGGL